MKKLFVVACSLAAGVPLFAQEQQQSPIDRIGDSLAAEMGKWSKSITDFFVDNISVITGIIGVGLAIGLVWVAYRLFRKATGKAS